MTQVTAATSFNVQATLNQWMLTHLNNILLPEWMSTAPITVLVEPNDVTAALPCYALYHIPVGMSQAIQGNRVGDGEKGGMVSGLLEISCYVSKNALQSGALLRTMQDWVMALAVGDTIVPVLDFASDLYTPQECGYKIDIGDLTEVTVETDPNPDVSRVRLLLDYSYTFRVQG